MEISHNIFKILFVLNLVLIQNFVSASPNYDLDHGEACVLKDNEHGICKEIFECDYAKQLFRERKNSEIMNYRCKFRGRMPYVCCPSPVSRIDDASATEKIEEITEASTTTEQHKIPVLSTEKSVSSDDDFNDNFKNSIDSEEEIEISSTKAPTKPKQSKFRKALCENETPDVQLGMNIIGGEHADIGEFPFQAAIGYRKALEGDTAEENSIKYKCGGSLIADDVVISAAHCFGFKQLTAEVVRLGRTSLDYNDNDDYSDGDDVEIEHVKIHPGYSRTNKFNDIALIKLKRAVNSSSIPIIKSICLSTNDENLPKNFTITGFGRNDVNTRKTSDWLLKATVNEISVDNCNEMMLNTTTIIETQTCALGHKGADSCQGDSGGPMSFERDFGGGKLTYLHGIVSYGASCGSAFPGIYTKVNKYLDWIEQEMNLMEQQ